MKRKPKSKKQVFLKSCSSSATEGVKTGVLRLFWLNNICYDDENCKNQSLGPPTVAQNTETSGGSLADHGFMRSRKCLSPALVFKKKMLLDQSIKRIKCMECENCTDWLQMHVCLIWRRMFLFNFFSNIWFCFVHFMVLVVALLTFFNELL